MMLYQTGELAEMCNVTIRTVQYYDNKGLLSACTNNSTHNNRRYFDETSKEKLETILILKSFGFKLKDIKRILDGQVELKVIRALINDKLMQVDKDIRNLKTLQREMKQYQTYISKNSTQPLTKIIDTQQYIKTNRQYNKIPLAFISKLLPLSIVQNVIVIYSIYKKSWKPILLNLPLLFVLTLRITYRYYRSIEYLCPSCQQMFTPEFITWTLARHTSNTRELKCSKCQEINDCIAMKK